MYILLCFLVLYVDFAVLDYGNTQLTNQIASVAVTNFVSYVTIRSPGNHAFNSKRCHACGRRTELLQLFFPRRNQEQALLAAAQRARKTLEKACREKRVQTARRRDPEGQQRLQRTLQRDGLAL